MVIGDELLSLSMSTRCVFQHSRESGLKSKPLGSLQVLGISRSAKADAMRGTGSRFRTKSSKTEGNRSPGSAVPTAESDGRIYPCLRQCASVLSSPRALQALPSRLCNLCFASKDCMRISADVYEMHVSEKKVRFLFREE